MTPADVVLAPGITARPEDLVYAASRASGPGGQHVNTSDTRVTLRVAVGAIAGGDGGFPDRLRSLAGRRLTDADEILIACDETRSQARNRELVLERLRELVAKAAHRPKKRRKTKPSRAAKERRLKAKARQGEKKARRRKPSAE